MDSRFNIEDIEPKAFKAMLGLEKYLHQSGLNKTHLELIKLRASQINGCAYCLDMHLTDALKQGETAKRIVLLNAWRDTELFTPEEQVLLEMTEEITLIHQHGLSDTTYAKARQVFDENYIAQALMAVVAINSWNRLQISTRQMVK